MHPYNINIVITRPNQQTTNTSALTISLQYSPNGLPPFTIYNKELIVNDTPFNINSLLPLEINNLIAGTITADGSVVLENVINNANLTIITPASIATTTHMELSQINLRANKIILTKTINAEKFILTASSRLDNMALLTGKTIDIHSPCIFHNYGEIFMADRNSNNRISVGSLFNHNKIEMMGELYAAAKKHLINKAGASIIAAKKITIASKKLDSCIMNYGIIKNGGKLSIISTLGLIANKTGGSIHSKFGVTTTGKWFINSGLIHGDIYNEITCCNGYRCGINTSEGVIDSNGTVNFVGGHNLNNYGKIKGHAAVDVKLCGDLNNLEHASISSELRIALASARNIINEAIIESNGSVSMTANNINNTETASITAKTIAAITAFSTIKNAGLINTQELNIKAGTLSQSTTGKLISATNAKIKAWKNVYNAGLMHATLDLLVKGYGEIANVAASKMYAGRLLCLNARQIANEGSLESKQTLLLKAIVRLSQSPLARAIAQQSLTMLSYGDLYLAGELKSNGDALLKASAELIANTDCAITSDESLQLIAGDITTAATIKTDGQLLLKAVDQLTQFVDGKLIGKDVHISARTATNSGSIVARKKLELEFGSSLTNLLTGILEAGTKLELTANMAENIGTIQAFGKLQAQIASVFSNYQQGKIIATKDLLITASMILENAGTIEGKEKTILEAAEWFKQWETGKTTAVDDFKLNTKLLDNFGTISSSNKLHIKATSLLQNHEQGHITAEETLTIIADSLTNAGDLSTESFLNTEIQHIFKNHANGIINAKKAIELLGATLVVNAGNITSLDDIIVTAQICLDTTKNSNITAAQALTTISEFAIQNSGKLQAEKIHLEAKQFLALAKDSMVAATKEALLKASSISQESTVKASTITITSDWLANNGDIACNELTITCKEALQNLLNGKITAKQTATIITEQGFINLGTLIAQDNLSITAKHLYQTGTLGSNNICLKAIDLMLHGDVQAGGNLLAIIDGNFTYETAALKANGDIILTLKNGCVITMPINTHGGLSLELLAEDGKLLNLTSVDTGKDLTINTPGCAIINGILYGSQSSMNANGSFIATCKSFNNDAGAVATENNLAITTTENFNHTKNSSLTAKGDMNLTSTAGKINLQGKPLTIGGFLNVIAEGDVTISENIAAQDALIASLTGDVAFLSTMSRKYQANSENFDDAIAKIRIAAKNILTIYAGGNILFQAVETQSGLKTQAEALGNIIDMPIELIQQRVQHYYGKVSGTITERNIKPATSTHKSSGDINMVSKNGSITAYAPEYNAKTVTLTSEQGKTAVLDATERHECETHLTEKTRRWYGSRTSTTDSISITEHSKGAKSNCKLVKISGDKGVTIRNLNSTATRNIFSAAHGKVSIEQGRNHFFESISKQTKSAVWQKQSSAITEATTYTSSSLPGAIEINANQINVETVRGNLLEFLQRIQHGTTPITTTMLNEQYYHEAHSAQGPSGALAAVVSIGVGILTMGAGAAAMGGLLAELVGTAAANAGFAALCAQAANALLANGLDPFKAVKSMTNEGTLKSLAIAMASAGLMDKIGGKLGLPKAAKLEGFSQHLQYNMINAAIATSLNVAGGQKVEEALKSGLINAVVNTASGVAARKIGEIYKPGKTGSIDAVTHKILHGFVGGASGAAFGGTKGALAGATGAIIAETVAGALKPTKQNVAKTIKLLEEKHGRALTAREKQQVHATVSAVYQAKVAKVAHIAEFTAANAALFTQQDVNIAARAATNALDNNFKKTAGRDVEADDELNVKSEAKAEQELDNGRAWQAAHEKDEKLVPQKQNGGSHAVHKPRTGKTQAQIQHDREFYARLDAISTLRVGGNRHNMVFAAGKTSKENVKVKAPFSVPSMLPDPTKEKNKVLAHIYATGRGIEKGRDAITNIVLHPIDTVCDTAQTILDGWNVLADVTIGISTAGARQRNAVRGAAINNAIEEFITGNSLKRTEMLSQFITSGILGAAVGGVTRGSAVYALEKTGFAIKTNYGHAFQSLIPEALQARKKVLGGTMLYRGEALGRSTKGVQGQFWALEKPGQSATYAKRYGLPPQNLPFDIVNGGHLLPKVKFITRKAPPVGANPGGAIEVVTKSNSVRLKFIDGTRSTTEQLTGRQSSLKQHVRTLKLKLLNSELTVGALIAATNEKTSNKLLK